MIPHSKIEINESFNVNDKNQQHYIRYFIDPQGKQYVTAETLFL